MSLALLRHQRGYMSLDVTAMKSKQLKSRCSIDTVRRSISLSGLCLDKKSPSREGPESLVQGRDYVISSRGQSVKMYGLYTTKPSRAVLHLPICQRLLGVRPGNMKTLESELTLFMMRPAGREQIKRIDDKIRYSNQRSRLLTFLLLSDRTSKG